MSFQLKKVLIGVNQSINIAEDEYLRLIESYKGLFELLSIEEKYDILLRSYIEYEQTLHELSLSRLMFSEVSWSYFIDNIQVVNLKLLNLLSMCRTYVDHIPQHLNAVILNPEFGKDKFDLARKHEYDSALGYRVLYALRNYVQHCGLPVHGITFNSRWIDPPEMTACCHTTTPYLTVSILEQESGFKKIILDELSQIGEKIDITPLVRENMSSFGKLHSVVRELVKAKAQEWDDLIVEARNRFSSHYGNDLIGLSAVQIEEGKIVNQQSLFDDMIKRRKLLENKNRVVINVQKHFITGQLNI